MSTEREVSGVIAATLMPKSIRRIAERLSGLDQLASLALANELEIALGKKKLHEILKGVRL